MNEDSLDEVVEDSIKFKVRINGEKAWESYNEFQCCNRAGGIVTADDSEVEGEGEMKDEDDGVGLWVE